MAYIRDSNLSTIDIMGQITLVGAVLGIIRSLTAP